MIQIFLTIFGEKNEILSQFIWGTYIFGTVASTFKLIASCLINGIAYDESKRFQSTLDGLEFNNDSEMTREGLIFMSMSRELTFGFTIAGFMPMKKSTLLSVSRTKFLIFFSD